MKVAVLTRVKEPFSLRVYRESLVRELGVLGVEFVPFSEAGPIPEVCDLLWEPALAGNRSPHTIFKACRKSVVATVHGAAPFTMPWRDIYSSALTAIRQKYNNLWTQMGWQWFRPIVSAAIVVSEFGANEVANIFGLKRAMVNTVYHGVDHGVFCIDGKSQDYGHPYLLHVSQYQPKKNVVRLVAAYALLPESTRPDLVLVLPGFRGEDFGIKGVKLIREGMEHFELARWYRGAIGFVFPSLHETFGMPIIEAMACGCPVITSNVTACYEVSGGAALLVNPRSVDDIAGAMRRLVEDEELRVELREKGLERSGSFSWQKSAEEHLKVFEQVLRVKPSS